MHRDEIRSGILESEGAILRMFALFKFILGHEGLRALHSLRQQIESQGNREIILAYIFL